MMLDWERVSALPWKQRNAEVEASVRKHLAAFAHPSCITTMELAADLLGAGGASEPDGDRLRQWTAKLAHLLTRLAPYLAPFARHDGETIKRYGKTWRRWNWYGQGGVT